MAGRGSCAVHVQRIPTTRLHKGGGLWELGRKGSLRVFVSKGEGDFGPGLLVTQTPSRKWGKNDSGVLHTLSQVTIVTRNPNPIPLLIKHTTYENPWLVEQH